jgi:hypothetical protein
MPTNEIDEPVNDSTVKSLSAEAQGSRRRFSRRTAMAAAGAHGFLVCMVAKARAAIPLNVTSLNNVLETWRGAMLAGNGVVLENLLHDHLKYMHSSGLVQTKADVLHDLAGKKFFSSLGHVESTAEIVDNLGVAVLTVDQVKNLSDGKTRASRIKVETTWINKEGQWKLLTRASALISQTPAAMPSPTIQTQ